MQDIQGLAEYVKRHMAEQNLNLREVAERSNGDITHQTVWNVLNQEIEEVKDQTLIALARALKVPEDEIFAVVRGRAGNDEYTTEEKRVIGYLRALPPDLRPEVVFVMEKLSQRHLQNGPINDPAMMTVPLSTATPRRKKTPATKTKAG